MMVNFFEMWQHRPRRPRLQCGPAWPAHDMKAYVLCSFVSGMVQWGVVFGAISAMMSITYLNLK